MTVPVTAGATAGETIVFSQRGAGTDDLPLNNNTYKQANNTFGFQEYYSQVVTLCRPTDDVPLATIKVVEPYSPEFTIAVTGDEAAGSERTVTATIPNKEVTGEVKFIATPKAGGENIDLGTGEIKDGTATATKKIDNPGDYEVTATLTSPRKVYEDSTANADLKVTAIASEVQLVENQSLTVDVPGELKVTVAKGAQGKVTISKDDAELGSTDTINADGSATVKNVTLNVLGAQEVDVVFESSNTGFESSQSKGSVQVNDKNESSLTLTPSNANPKVNEAVTLTATVEETDADGAVQFKDGDDVLGTVNLNDNNEATYSYTPTEEGKKTLTAVFVPAENSTYKGNQTTAELNVQPAAEHTGITLEAPAKAKATEEVTLTATVEPSNVAGAVEFFNGTNSLGAGEYDPATGVATLKKQLPAGTHNVTAKFTPNDQTAYNGQTSEPQTIEVSNVATQVEYNGDLGGKLNQAITLSAKVEADGQPVDGGTVQFNVGALNPVTAEVKNGVAEVEHTFASAGTRNVTAQYVPAQNSGYTGNTARASVAIKDEASVQLTASKTDPIVDEEVTLTAKVTPAQASGKVQLKDGDKVIEEKGLTGSNNQATFTFSPENTESKTFIAVYVPGDSSNYIAGDAGSVTITPKDAEQTTLTVAANKPSGTTEDEITLTATVPAGAQGKVQFSNNGQPLGDEQTVSNGTATLTTALPEGDNTITAQFTSDNTNAFTNATVPAADAATVAITKPAEKTGVTVEANKTTAKIDEQVQLTATVSPAAAGTVEFYNGDAKIDGTVSYDPTTGEATLNTTLPEGRNAITARFTSADQTKFTNAETPADGAAIVTVAKKEDDTQQPPAQEATAPTVTVTAPTGEKTTDDEVTLTAKITPASAGTVEFFNGDTKIDGTVDYDPATGEATLTTKLAEGDYTVTAKFTPAEDNTTAKEATSEAAPAFTVKKKEEQQPSAPEATAPTVTVTAPAGEKTTDDEVTLTAKVDPASAGTVEFFNGDTKIDGTVDYDPATGEATLTTTLAEGDYTVTAKFTPAEDNTTAKEATSEAAPAFTVKKKEEQQQPPAPEATAPTVTVTAPAGEKTTADEITLTAKITPASAGTVEFFNGDTKIDGTVDYDPATGEATLTTKLAEGDYTVTAKFTPAEDNTTAKEATSEAAPKFTVTKKTDNTQQPPAQEATAPTVTVTAPTGEKTTADEITLTAKITPASAGTVEFFNGDTKIDGTVDYDPATGEATLTTTLAEGDYTVTAKFTPAEDNTTAKEATSETAPAFTVKKKEEQQPSAPEATAPTVTVTAPAGEKTTDDEVTLTAKVDPASAGTVEFFNGDTKIDGTVDYDPATGEATLTTKLAEGDYTVTAKFTPAEDNTTAKEATSEAAPAFTVKKKEEQQQPPAPEATAPTVTVTAPAGEKTTADEITLTAKITPASAGTVEFFNGDTKIDGTVDYDPATGEATLTTKLAEGDYTVTAKFTPAEDNTTAKEATSEAAPKFTVTKKTDNTQQPPAQEATAPTVTVTAPAGEKTTDDEVTLTAKVDPASAGTVEFFNGDTKIDGTVAYDPATGEATLTTKLPAGANAITAKFTPAADNTTATEATSQVTEVNVTEKTDDQPNQPTPNQPNPNPAPAFTPQVKNETRTTTEGATLPAPSAVLSNASQILPGSVLYWSKLPTEADPVGEITVINPDGTTATAKVAFTVTGKTDTTNGNSSEGSSQSSEGSSLSRPAIIGISVTAVVLLLGLLGFGLANNQQFKDFVYTQFGIRL
ncbi:Ig-like domain repeat protein [Corynebacterium sp. Marseille-P4321]|uniref:Ig-like domain repeat protein n=1 Tax=Corynebacterium sp. Marseille-P4321 TaxID=2736603 RepID=UPI00158CA201|nr:Ig-like domain repeat protein [Corynebacterium sp. Marseille-P4321]